MFSSFRPSAGDRLGQTVPMRRRHGTAATVAMLILAGFMIVTLALGGRQPRAAAMPGQVITTSSHRSTPPSSAPASTVARTTPTTRTVSTTKPVRTAPTAPARVVPAVPYTSPTQYQAPATPPPTTAPPAPTTTIVGIGGHL